MPSSDTETPGHSMMNHLETRFIGGNTQGRKIVVARTANDTHMSIHTPWYYILCTHRPMDGSTLKSNIWTGPIIPETNTSGMYFSMIHIANRTRRKTKCAKATHIFGAIPTAPPR